MGRPSIARRACALAALALVAGLAAAGCGGSAAPSPSAAGAQQTTVYAVALEAAVRNLSMAIQSYYVDNGSYPAAVTQAILGSYVSPWPDNPWTQRPIGQSMAVGDVMYTMTANGFRLAGHKADGTDVVVP